MKKIGLFLLLTLFVCVGCKQKQKVITAKPAVASGSLVEQVLSVEPHYKTMHLSKMSMVLVNADHQFKFRGSIKVLSDSLISISVLPMMGIEMFRVNFTPKGFMIVDKFNRQYAEGTYDYIKSKWGIVLDFKAVEALMSNQLFMIPAPKEPLQECFTVQRQAGGQLLRSVKPVMERYLDFIVDSNSRISEVDLNDGSTSMMKVNYSDLKEFDKVQFPSNVAVSIQQKKQRMSLEFQIERAVFNTDLTVSPIDVTRYTKVVVTQLLP